MTRARTLALAPALVLLALAACTEGGATDTAPVIVSFGSFPASVAQGQPSTLKWSVTGATILTINSGVGVVTGLTEKAVTPSVTTTYTLTAEGPGGTSTAQATVTVTAPLPAPTITSFAANPTSILPGGTSTLSWTVSNATTLSIDQGVGTVTGTSKTVSPSATTTYTLTATNSSGSVTATATVSVGAAGLRLDYADPSDATKKILLVRNASSTSNKLVLDVKVGTAAIPAAFGVALNLPLDHTKATFDPATGITVPGGGPLQPGTGAGSTLGGKQAVSGPLADFVTIGVARKKSLVADGDVSLAANTVLFSISLDLVTSPDPANGDLFNGASLPAKAKLGVLKKDGTSAVLQSEFGIGRAFVTH